MNRQETEELVKKLAQQIPQGQDFLISIPVNGTVLQRLKADRVNSYYLLISLIRELDLTAEDIAKLIVKTKDASKIILPIKDGHGEQE